MEEAKAGSGIGVELFEPLLERKVWVVEGDEGEQGAAQEGEVGESAGVAGARAVFAPEVVAAPVVADLDAGPVSADQVMPLLRGAFVGLLAGEVETAFRGGLVGLAGVNLTAHHHDAAGAGKADGVWFYGKAVQAALLGAAMAFGVLDKKRVALSASKAWACFRSAG